MEKEELEARNIVSNNLLESPFKSTFGADGGMRVAFNAGLIHPYQHSSWLTRTHVFTFLTCQEISAREGIIQMLETEWNKIMSGQNNNQGLKYTKSIT